jgi:hypothetical protein
MDKQNGTWFAEFYLSVAHALLTAFPEIPNPETGAPNSKTGIVVGGPVTYSPPFLETAGQIDDKTWIDWFEPLIRASVDNPNLLGWVDFHAYDGADPHGKCQPGPNCLNAEASTIDINLQEIAIVSEALGMVRVFRQECEQARDQWHSSRVSTFFLPVHTVNFVQTLKVAPASKLPSLKPTSSWKKRVTNLIGLAVTNNAGWGW